MDRAAKLIARMNIPGGPTLEEVIRRLWPTVVGKVVARHTRVYAIYEGKLLVAVEDESWRSQLGPLEGQILKRLREVLGQQAVSRIVFRRCALRHEPARAESAQATDEAEGIADHVLRRLYMKERAKWRA
jgi:hypothetical protein